ncbi:MAG TPA: hypothetical protein VLQ80_21675, partial [Candidatus Saccharimonadia bacterium]|nr:hypothetical protein [Candidatus Saccharimonadia bacterium]
IVYSTQNHAEEEPTMRDNLRRSRAICHALTPASPGAPHGNLARPLHTRVARISGIGGSQSTPLPHLAAKGPKGTQPARRVKRLARWFDNAHRVEAGSFLPEAALVLPPGAWETLGRVMDGSVVGRGCNALRLHVLSPGRALPLAWRVRPGPKGHVPAALPIALVALVSGLRPEGAQGVCRGDGAWDGTRRPPTVQGTGWASGCRTGCHRTAWWDGATGRLDTWGTWSTPGTLGA